MLKHIGPRIDTDSHRWRRLLLFQKTRIERAREQIGNVKFFRLSVQICENNGRVARKLPDDLAAGAAGRRQRFRVGNDGKLSKLPFTFRQGFPNRDAFRADSQSITRALDVAAGVNFAARCAYRSADKKI